MSIDNVISILGNASTATAVKSWKAQEDGNGYLYVEPALSAIASAANATEDEIALAALVCSEVGSLPAQYQYAVAEVGLNEARARGVRVSELLCGAPKPGHCGEQRGRWAATSRPPTVRHLIAARLAMQGGASGFVRSARKFYDPKVQDGGTQRGRPLQYDALGIARKWYGEGFQWVGPITIPLIGTMIIDPYRLMLMRQGGGVSLSEAEDAIADGRHRWKTPLSSDTSNASREEPEDDESPGAAASGLLTIAAVVTGGLLIARHSGVL